MLSLAVTARGLSIDTLISHLERGIEELRALSASRHDTLDTGFIPSEWPAEHLHLKVTGESGVHAGQLVTDEAFDCPCGAHVSRGRPFFEDDTRYCIDCGIREQESV